MNINLTYININVSCLKCFLLIIDVNLSGLISWDTSMMFEKRIPNNNMPTVGLFEQCLRRWISAGYQAIIPPILITFCSLHLYIFMSLSLSPLSLTLYIHLYTHTYTCVCVCVYMACTHESELVCRFNINYNFYYNVYFCLLYTSRCV